MVLRMALLVAALSVRHVANGDMTFLERQQMLARQMWEDEMEISKQVAGAGAESATADEDEYDGYYDEDYYEAPEPLEEIVFVPKPAVKRKVRGYAISEETGLFQDILKPITYLDLLTAVASMIKCDSPTINGMNNAKRAQSVKEKTSAKSTATVAAEVPVDDQVDGKPRKLSFKEKQERKMKDRKAKELETAKPKEVVKFQMGADCEDIICAACGTVVYEFGQALKRESENPQMKFISDVARGFCGNKEIRSKYGDLVEHICKQLFDKEATGHAHALMYRFQDTSDWDAVATIQYLVPHQRQYCVDAMMCKPEMFVFQSEPTLPAQEDWTKECFVCHAVAKHLEAQSGLYNILKDPNRLVAEACDRLRLPGEFDGVCREIFGGSRIDDIGWLIKVHHEAVTKSTMSSEKFPSYMCGEIKQCVKMEDLNKPKELEVEAPFW